jgi:hypothetical protein
MLAEQPSRYTSLLSLQNRPPVRNGCGAERMLSLDTVGKYTAHDVWGIWSSVLPEKLRGPKYHVPFPQLGLYRWISLIPRLFKMFVTWLYFCGEHLWAIAQPPSWKTAPCRLSATAYSIYLQLPSIYGGLSPSATWGRAVSWSQWPTYHGFEKQPLCTWSYSAEIMNSVE